MITSVFQTTVGNAVRVNETSLACFVSFMPLRTLRQHPKQPARLLIYSLQGRSDTRFQMFCVAKVQFDQALLIVRSLRNFRRKTGSRNLRSLRFRLSCAEILGRRVLPRCVPHVPLWSGARIAWQSELLSLMMTAS